MFLHYRTRGFILKKADRGEADRIFTTYTKDFGKLEIFGKAIRKIKSKLRGGIGLFYLSDIEFIEGKTHKTLTDTILIDSFKNLRGNLERLVIAYKISEVLDNLIRGQEKDKKIWQLLKEVFEKLNNWRPPTYHPLEIESYKLEIIYYYFLWQLLSLLGYEPQLYNCSLCQQKLKPETLYFLPEEGGVICQECFKKLKKGKEINPEVVKVLRLILRKDWEILSKIKIEKPLTELLKKVSEDYLNELK